MLGVMLEFPDHCICVIKIFYILANSVDPYEMPLCSLI